MNYNLNVSMSKQILSIKSANVLFAFIIGDFLSKNLKLVKSRLLLLLLSQVKIRIIEAVQLTKYKAITQTQDNPIFKKVSTMCMGS